MPLSLVSSNAFGYKAQIKKALQDYKAFAELLTASVNQEKTLAQHMNKF
jgi:hypothetical protein